MPAAFAAALAWGLMQAELSAELAQLRAWLLDAALPLWLARGIDHARGGFFEALDLRTRECAAPFRRLRVVARQIVVFSQAHALGVAGAEQAVRLGLHFLQTHAALADGGYAWRFNLAHEPVDRTRDLYDHAFVLLSFASAARLAGADTLRQPALALLSWLDERFAHPAGGYLESLPPALPRRQNPHMHLLEALLAAAAVFGDAVFHSRAQALVALFDTRLFDTTSGALPEFFDDSLNPAREDATFLVEPGHHCEWVWLRHQAASLGLAVPPEVSTQLMAFVDRHAINPATGALFDALDSNGAVRAAGSRLWPQTERLRAEFRRGDPTVARQLQSVRALAAHLRPDGLWHERRLADGAFADMAAPASSLYHLAGAILAVT